LLPCLATADAGAQSAEQRLFLSLAALHGQATSESKRSSARPWYQRSPSASIFAEIAGQAPAISTELLGGRLGIPFQYPSMITGSSSAWHCRCTASSPTSPAGRTLALAVDDRQLDAQGTALPIAPGFAGQQRSAVADHVVHLGLPEGFR
jgi:hypothetical protein